MPRGRPSSGLQGSEDGHARLLRLRIPCTCSGSSARARTRSRSSKASRATGWGKGARGGRDDGGPLPNCQGEVGAGGGAVDGMGAAGGVELAAGGAGCAGPGGGGEDVGAAGGTEGAGRGGGTDRRGRGGGPDRANMGGGTERVGGSGGAEGANAAGAGIDMGLGVALTDGRRCSRSAAALSTNAFVRVSSRVKRSASPPTPLCALGLKPMTRPSPRIATCPEERTISKRSRTPSARGCAPTSVTPARVTVSSSCCR